MNSTAEQRPELVDKQGMVLLLPETNAPPASHYGV